MIEAARLGGRIRRLRRTEGWTQAELAERLGISASYLNLIENQKRTLTAAVLLKLSSVFDVDARALLDDREERLEQNLREVLGDPLYEGHPVPDHEVAELVRVCPDAAKAFLHTFQTWRDARSRSQSLSDRIIDEKGGAVGVESARLSSEHVSDLVERRRNHFPELEELAERLGRDIQGTGDEIFPALSAYLLRKHKVTVQIQTVAEMRGALRRYDPKERSLFLSEVLRRGSRNFQLAHQAVRLEGRDLLLRLADVPAVAGDASRRLARVALANYAASAVLMPYDTFLAAAVDVRYDIDLLGHRFRTSFEQVCHRLTTLRRPGHEGVPFHLVRVDIAGNLSKHFSPTRMRFPRFSGLCPLWNVHAAFLQPGFIRTQMQRLPDGDTFFSVARTVRKHRGGYRAENVLNAIAIGCAVEHAKKIVYADGVDLKNRETAEPVGITCRTCERMDCQARAFPPIHEGLRIDEDVRGVSFYAPAS